LAFSSLEVFADDLVGHIAGEPCSSAGLRTWLPVPSARA
jgi:hypothetical protein